MLVKLNECVQGWRRLCLMLLQKSVVFVADDCRCLSLKSILFCFSSSFHENRCYYIHQCVSAVGLTKRVCLGLFGLNTTTCLCYSEAEGLKWSWLGAGTFCVLWSCTVGLSCTTVWVILQYNRFISSFMWRFKQLLKKTVIPLNPVSVLSKTDLSALTL